MHMHTVIRIHMHASRGIMMHMASTRQTLKQAAANSNALATELRKTLPQQFDYIKTVATVATIAVVATCVIITIIVVTKAK